MLRRHRLHRAARRYAGHDWPVVPGARLAGDRFDCDQLGCPTVTCHPAVPDWERTASRDPDRLAGWWQRADYGVLLATGHRFDVLEVAGPLGRRLAAEARGPVAVAPPQRWMILIGAGADLPPELAGHSCVVLHRGGSWIPAPPTPLPTGAVRWVVRPQEFGWEPADPVRVQRTAARILRCSEDGRRRRPLGGPPVLGPGGDHQPRDVWPLNGAHPVPIPE